MKGKERERKNRKGNKEKRIEVKRMVWKRSEEKRE